MQKAAGGMVYRFMVHVVPGVVRPLRVLWNQMIGFIFLVMAASAAPATVRSARNFTGDMDSIFRVGLGAVFMAVMLYFGISSLVKARRITRS